MLIAQITDTHISLPDGEPERRFRTSAHLQRAIRHLNALPRRPDAVLMTGDLVDVGTAEEYRLLKELIAPLEVPVYLIPGNHDDREALRSAFAEHSYLPADGYLQYTVEDLPVRLIALDTHVPGEVGGLLCAERRRWLDARLAEQPDRPTLIFMHHPPLASGNPRMDGWGLAGAEALGEVVTRHPQVERIICGHLHRPVIWGWCGTVVSVCPSTAHQIGLVVGRSDKEDPLRLVMEPPCCHLHMWHEGASLVSHTSYIGNYPAEPSD